MQEQTADHDVTCDEAQELYWKALSFSRRVGDAWALQSHENYALCSGLWGAIQHLHATIAFDYGDKARLNNAYQSVVDRMHAVHVARYPKSHRKELATQTTQGEE
jgi:hypothetical protein